MGSSSFYFGGSGDGSAMVELLGVYVEAEMVSTIGMSDGNIYGNIEGYQLVEWTFSSE